MDGWVAAEVLVDVKSVPLDDCICAALNDQSWGQ
jgi:hypothetical protein